MTDAQKAATQDLWEGKGVANKSSDDVFWIPLESNPDMLTAFARAVGLPQEYRFVDIWGVDEELLQSIDE